MARAPWVAATRGPSYGGAMPRPARTVAACLVALALGAPAAAAAPADPTAVYADYFRDGVIDGDHAPRDLIAAAREKNGDPQYGAFAEAVDDALTRRLAGVRRTGGDRDDGLAPMVDYPRPPAPGVRRSFERERPEAATPLLPAPGPPDQRGNPPWPLLALSAMAGALVVTGAGSSAYRRLRPRRAPGDV